MYFNQKERRESTDLESSPWLTQALADAFKFDSIEAVNAAAMLYQILSDAISAEQPHVSFCRKHPMPC